MYDVFARSLKRLRVVITIDSRFSARKEFRVDVQDRVSLEIVLDSTSEMKKKMKEKKKNATKKIAKIKDEEEKKERKKNENDEADDDDEKNDDVDVRVVQIVVSKQV